MAATNHPTFYSIDGLLTETYDARAALHIAGSPVEGDVEFYLDLAQRLSGPVLDVGCGTSRLAAKQQDSLPPIVRARLEFQPADGGELVLELFDPRFAVRAEHGDFRGSAPAYGQEQVWVVERAS